MSFNERKNNNNWRIALVMLSSDIRKKGMFSIEMKSGETIRKATDEELLEYLDMDVIETSNDVVNNVLNNIAYEHPRNPNSDKFWRGDIQDCYAMIKNILFVHLMAATIRSPESFGWSVDKLDELKSGRTLLETYAEYKILREAFLCETEIDMGYLYQKVYSMLFPHPTEGILKVPICKYEFKR